MVVGQKKGRATGVARQKEYMARRKEAGWKRVCVMVPGRWLPGFMAEVARMKKEWNQEETS